MAQQPSGIPNGASGAEQASAATPAFSPLYQQIKGLLMASLQAGEWKPGEAIPSEMDLAGRYRVSQGTVRKAIDELAAENLVVRRQGKGTFVTTHFEQQANFRFLRLTPDAGPTPAPEPPQRHIIDCRRARAPADVARALAMKTGESVLQLRRVLSFSGRPTILEDIWLPGHAFKGLTIERLASDQRPMYAMFEAEFNVHMVRAEEKIRAVLPEPEQRDLLKLDSARTPLLSVERLAFTYKDLPMELRRGLYLTDSHHYRNVLS